MILSPTSYSKTIPVGFDFSTKISEFDFNFTGLSPSSEAMTYDEWREYMEKVISLVYPAVTEAAGTQQSAMVNRLNSNRHQLLADTFPAGTTLCSGILIAKTSSKPSI